jgi:protein required for attachment to host cells
MDPKDIEINWTPEEEEAFEAKTHQQAQEEAHKHFVIQEFSAIVLADGAASTLGQMTEEARHDIQQMILHQYMQRLTEANQGL